MTRASQYGKMQKFDKQYLEGKYGADPYLRKIIDWGRLMPKKAGMEAWKKKRRKEYLEKREFRYYIFCEGQQTEPFYFEGFKDILKKIPFTEIWC